MAELVSIPPELAAMMAFAAAQARMVARGGGGGMGGESGEMDRSLAIGGGMGGTAMIAKLHTDMREEEITTSTTTSTSKKRKNGSSGTGRRKRPSEVINPSYIESKRSAVWQGGLNFDECVVNGVYKVSLCGLPTKIGEGSSSASMSKKNRALARTYGVVQWMDTARTLRLPSHPRPIVNPAIDDMMKEVIGTGKMAPPAPPVNPRTGLTKGGEGGRRSSGVMSHPKTDGTQMPPTGRSGARDSLVAHAGTHYTHYTH